MNEGNMASVTLWSHSIAQTDRRENSEYRSHAVLEIDVFGFVEKLNMYHKTHKKQ